MDSFIDTSIWQIAQLEILNRVRRYKCVFFKSDILQPDGRTVLPSMMDKSQGTSNWTFPREKPTGKDIELWQGALQHLTSENLILQQSMGPYINKPHKLTGWYLSSNSLYLYKKSENGTYDTYRASTRSRSSCRQKYVGCVPSYIPPLDPNNHKHAFVKVNSRARTVSVVSSAPMYQPPVNVRRPIPEILRSWPNPGSWNELECDGDMAGGLRMPCTTDLCT